MMDRQISLVDVCLLANNEDAADQYLEQLNIGAIPHCNGCNHQMSLLKDKCHYAIEPHLIKYIM